jgi:signal transduction histidine kinase
VERLYAATTAISAAVDDEPRLLKRIVEELATLLDARYAALGILGDDGALVHFETTGLTPEEEALLRPQPPHGRGILGALLHEGKPLRLDDLTQDPRSVGFPPGHPHMRTFLGVPLLVGERVLGRLYATERRGAPFTAEDEALALGFAGAAAVAIQSARQTARLVEAERLRATGQLAMGIAHDFNNLLATILGRAEVLRGQVRDAEQRESLEAIQRAARDGAATVARMREYGRPVDVAEFRPLDLAALARETADLTRPRWQNEALRQGRTIDVRLALEPAPPVHGDPAALREALVNLIFNAVDALPQGGAITLGVRPVPPGPSNGAGGAGRQLVELSVADTGVGMPEDVRRRCLEPFFSTKDQQGTGLGLALVHATVQRHRGSLTVDSEPGRGTSFSVRLPIHGEPAAAPVVEPGEWSRRLRVLVVEDDPLVRMAVTEQLTSQGHTVQSAANGLEGLDRFMSGRFDLVITDRAMPEMGGDQLATTIRQLAPNKPIIMLTGFGELMEVKGERPLAVDAVLSKPVTLDSLTLAIRQVIARH